MKSRFLLLLPLLILSACGKDKGGTSVIDNHPAEERQWNLAAGQVLTIQVPPEMDIYQDQIEQAAAVWNTAIGRGVIQFNFSGPRITNTQWTDTFSSLSDSIFGLYRQNTWNLGLGSGNLAYTAIKSQNNYIIHADVVFNFHDHIFDNDDAPTEANYVDFQSVLIHELGHFLGLAHPQQICPSGPTSCFYPDPNSVMIPTIGNNSQRRVLTVDDINLIRSRY